MIPATEQIKRAWEQLDNPNSSLEELRRCWSRLVAIRRELDRTVVELADRIEQLRIAVQKEEAEKPKPRKPKAAKPKPDDTETKEATA